GAQADGRDELVSFAIPFWREMKVREVLPAHAGFLHRSETCVGLRPIPDARSGLVDGEMIRIGLRMREADRPGDEVLVVGHDAGAKKHLWSGMACPWNGFAVASNGRDAECQQNFNAVQHDYAVECVRYGDRE